MATLKIKRSAVPNKVPTTFDLSLGEAAINTFDGKLYLRGEDSSGPFVREIGAGGGGGGGTWGSITGTLSDQTDLQAALNAKANLTGATFTGAVSVSGAGGANFASVTGDGSIELARGGGGAYIDFKDSTGEDFDVRLQATGSGLAIAASSITTSSNVTFGIGTSWPEARLDVNGTSILRGENGFVLFAPKSGTAPFGANYDRFEVRVDSAFQVTTIGNTHGGTGSPRALSLMTANLGRVFIDTSGNVGIGTTGPFERLHVEGNAYLSGTLNTGSSVTIRRQGDEGGELVLQKGNVSSLGGDVIIDQQGNQVRFYVNDGASLPQFRFDFLANTLTMPSGAEVWHSGNFAPSSKLDRAINTWVTSAEGAARFFFQGDGRTFYRGEGHEWRSEGDAPLLRMDNAGDCEFLGQTQRIRSTAPTFWWQDTDNRTFAIHVNSNLAYFMRGAADTASWTTLANGQWPMTLNLENGDLTVGGSVVSFGVFQSNRYDVGGDAFLSDVNVANTVRLTGKQDGAQGFLQFGNASGSLLGQTGDGVLRWNGTAVSLAGHTHVINDITNLQSVLDSKAPKAVPFTVTTGQTATTAVVGGGYLASGAITIPSGTFAQGDIFTIVNNSGSAISIIQGSGMTLRLVGTATTGTRSLAQRGIATVLFVSASEAILTGVT